MRKSLFIVLFLLAGSASSAFWGFYAHKHINQMAVYTLPPELYEFYNRNIKYIIKHSVTPDNRSHNKNITDEAQKHYLNVDCFPNMIKNGRIPENSAVYDTDLLNKHGTLPWNIMQTIQELTNAFKEQDSLKILHYSAFLGHYIADACVPLHTLSNYDGQETAQRGIHELWETKLPKLFLDSYNKNIDSAKYLPNPFQVIEKIIFQSYAAADSVLVLEAQLNNNYTSKDKYIRYVKGEKAGQIKDYSNAYATEYHTLLNGMVERRIRVAIHYTGSFWYTAWVNAGRPKMKKRQE